ncbi:hypothetical protein C5167_022431 [Papaver somniferum]|uniref:Uncharacterized protein n=1 Tax=Papaver somniferum TaxID=3469 RepID=A0A4Y7JJE0_PAPSO|nr:hypothetical protein C5167_022431 [Papaver somniferum]
MKPGFLRSRLCSWASFEGSSFRQTQGSCYWYQRFLGHAHTEYEKAGEPSSYPEASRFRG